MTTLVLESLTKKGDKYEFKMGDGSTWHFRSLERVIKSAKPITSTQAFQAMLYDMTQKDPTLSGTYTNNTFDTQAVKT